MLVLHACTLHDKTVQASTTDSPQHGRHILFGLEATALTMLTALTLLAATGHAAVCSVHAWPSS